MIKRDIQDLSSFIRINNFSDLNNENLGLKSGDNVFVLSNLTFYEVLSFNTLLGRDEIKITEDLKVKKIITIGDSTNLEIKITEIKSKLKEELDKKENNIEKKSGFNLEKTNEIIDDENKLLTSKAGSVLKQQIDNLNTRLSNINLTWDIIENKPIVTSIIDANSNKIPTEGSVFNFISSKTNALDTNITGRITVINEKITNLENKKINYDDLLNKPVISDSINSNLSNQIASSKAVKDTNDFLNNVNASLNNLNSDNADNKNKIIDLINEKKNIKTSIDELEKEKNNHKIFISSLTNNVNDLLSFKERNKISFDENVATFLTSSSEYHINGGSLNDNDIVTEFHFRKGNTISHADIYCGALNAQNKIISQDEIITSGDITAFSDIRLKSNIRKINNALNKVCQLNGYTYDMNNKRSTGVIAQEVEKVLPEVVQDREDGYKTVAYGNMIGLLIEAIKDLKEEIKEIKNGD